MYNIRFFNKSFITILTVLVFISILGEPTFAQNRRSKPTPRAKRNLPVKKQVRKYDADKSGLSVKHSPAIKVGGGFVMGVDGETPMYLAGDYLHPWTGRESFHFVGGGSYWSVSSVTVFTVEGGIEYMYPINNSGKLLAGARLTHAYLSNDIVKESKIGPTILGGYEHTFNSHTVGGEFRIPLISDVDANYIFFYYKWLLN